jgi:hypothetical protein
MSEAALQFLTTWSLQRHHVGPMTRLEAEGVTARWEQDALDNGISPADLHAAAGGDVTDYLLRTYGERGDEIEM